MVYKMYGVIGLVLIVLKVKLWFNKIQKFQMSLLSINDDAQNTIVLIINGCSRFKD